MAKAIINIIKPTPNRVDEQTQALNDLMAAAANNHKAVIKCLDILAELDKIGVLEAMQAMLKNRHTIGVIGITQLNKPGAHRMIKNGMELLQFMSQLDPAQLQGALNGVNSGLEEASRQQQGKQQGGLWGMLREMRGPDVRAALGFMTNFLKGMGRGLGKSH